jgi:hypothetical protein
MIANNKQIREELIARWTKMGLLHTIADKRYYSEIVTDAEERAPWMKITGDRLSKWLLGKPAGLTDSQVCWLANRWCLEVEVKVEISVQPYNEQVGIKKVKKLFPKQ